mgnify:CR=1 FL=1
MQRRPIRAQKEGGNREKAWSMLQGTTKKGKKTKALATRAFDRKSGTPGWIRTSGLPLRRRLLCPTELYGLIKFEFFARVYERCTKRKFL